MTRGDERLAGWIALLTAALLATSLYLHGSGPPSAEPDAVLAWYAGNSVMVRLGSFAWLMAMLGLVAFAVLLRDALLSLTADRWWAGVLFVQGAAVFATVAVIAAATAWTTALLARGPDPQADTVAAIWTLHQTVLRFATWGLVVPLLTVGITLTRHSVLGQVVAWLGGMIAVLLFVPVIWTVGLAGFVLWLVLTSMALLRPRLPRRRASRRRRKELEAQRSGADLNSEGLGE